jgi:hypothetical protein
MPAQSWRPKKLAIALLALLAVAILTAVSLSGNLNILGQPTNSTVTVSGKIIGRAFTEGNAVGNVTAMFFGPTTGHSQGNVPAIVKSDGTYSIRLTNGMNYTIFMNVVDPNNNADTGVCQGQTVSLNDLQKASYTFDITPVNCG